MEIRKSQRYRLQVKDYVYVIGDVNDLEDPYDYCYVGVTKYPSKRFHEHSKSSISSIGKRIKSFNWNIENNFKIIFSGNRDDCYFLENQLRPNANMGFNVAPGGQHPHCTTERNLKISLFHKGKIRTKLHSSNISKGKKAKGNSIGNKNGCAKKWIITNPLGCEYHLHGTLNNFCKEYNLNASVLRKHENLTVPNISPKFRSKNDEHKMNRINTTGWKLEVDLPKLF